METARIEQRRNLLAGVEHAGLHRVLRRADDLGDFGDRFFVIVDEVDDLAMRRRQLRQALPQSGSGGTQSVESGGSVQNTTMSGGLQNVLSGGAALSTIMLSGAIETISKFGGAFGTIVSSGAQQIAYGVANNTVLSNGGFEFVQSGGPALCPIVASRRGGHYSPPPPPARPAHPAAHSLVHAAATHRPPRPRPPAT